MSKVIASAVVSVDGFVALQDDSVGHLFDWYFNGSVAVTMGDPDRVFHMSQASADYLDRVIPAVRACVVGRATFDYTNGWEGVPPAGEHIFVVTHEPPADWPHLGTAPFTFVTEGVAAAVEQARAFAGDGVVSVTGGEMAGQALAAGVLDELHLQVTPVAMGHGKPYFATYAGPQVVLGDPEVIVGDRVVHTIYPVPRSPQAS